MPASCGGGHSCTHALMGWLTVTYSVADTAAQLLQLRQVHGLDMHSCHHHALSIFQGCCKTVQPADWLTGIAMLTFNPCESFSQCIMSEPHHDAQKGNMGGPCRGSIRGAKRRAHSACQCDFPTSIERGAGWPLAGWHSRWGSASLAQLCTQGRAASRDSMAGMQAASLFKAFATALCELHSYSHPAVNQKALSSTTHAT